MDLEQLRDQLTECYEDYRSTPLAYRTASDDSPARSREAIAAEFREFGVSYLERTGLVDEDYKVQIRALYEVCERQIDAKLVAAVVGCSVQHARRFAYDDDRGAHRKAWAEAAQTEKVSPGTRTRILERDDRSCRRCGSETELEVHHVLPVSRGGTNADENLATLCEDCHRAAHAGSKTSGEIAYEPDEFDAWVTSPSGRSGSPEPPNAREHDQRTLSDFTDS